MFKFLVLAFVILFICGLYTSYKLFSKLIISNYIKFPLITILTVCFCSWPMVRLYSLLSGEQVSFAVYISIYIFMATMSFLVPLIVFRDIYFYFDNKKKLKNREVNPERRRFIFNVTSGAIGLSAVAPITYGLNEAFSKPVVKKVTIPIENLNKDLVGLKIVQATDLHIGQLLHLDWTQKVVDIVNELSPDVFAITGDLIDGSVQNIGYQVEPLKNVKSTYGNYFVTGNHEFYSGVESWFKFVKGLGYTTFGNGSELLHIGAAKLLISGVWDYHGDRFGSKYLSSPKKAMRNAPNHDLSILLAHQPLSVKEASKVGYDVQISGHTHAGQFFPWTEVIKLIQPYVYGEYDVGKTKLYVSSGTGFWGPPIRIGTTPEIVCYTLTHKKADK